VTPFPCFQCGACCRQASRSPELTQLGYVLPNGHCKHFTPDNLCAIYDTRPECCVVGDGSKYGLTRIQYHTLALMACHVLNHDQ